MELGMTQNFVRVPVGKKVNADYLHFKNANTDKGKLWEDIEYFHWTYFKGYHWYTLAFRTKSIYDLYRVYEWDKLIAETEDEIVELPKWVSWEDKIIYAYQKKGDEYIIKWVSSICVSLPRRNKIKNYKLSVVVPLYKSELFMCRTVDGILSSSLDKIELILIDDGSTDCSYEIAQRYADHYGCVRAYHWENHGVSFARNWGLDLAQGEYIAFCDNDDIPHPFMYEILYNTCKKENTDIAIAQSLIRKDLLDKERYLTCSARNERTVVYTFEEMVKNRGTKGNIFWVAVWNKIVKTEIARKAQFPVGYTWPWILYEDVAYTWSLYSYIDRFSHCKDAIYTWDKRKQKTVGTASTWHQACDNEYVWKMFIYWFSYALYHKSWKHIEAHDYTHFKRLIESYDKFDRPSVLRTYWDKKLKELVNNEKLYDNVMIMSDKHLREVIERVR